MERISQEYFCHISHNILGVHSEICDIFCDWWSVFDFCTFCHIHHIPSLFPKLVQHSHHHLQLDWHLKHHKQDSIKLKVVITAKWIWDSSIFYSIKPKLDMWLFVDFCVFPFFYQFLHDVIIKLFCFDLQNNFMITLWKNW